MAGLGSSHRYFFLLGPSPSSGRTHIAGKPPSREARRGEVLVERGEQIVTFTGPDERQLVMQRDGQKDEDFVMCCADWLWEFVIHDSILY